MLIISIYPLFLIFFCFLFSVLFFYIVFFYSSLNFRYHLTYVKFGDTNLVSLDLELERTLRRLRKGKKEHIEIEKQSMENV